MNRFLYFSIHISPIQNVCREINPNDRGRMGNKVNSEDHALIVVKNDMVADF